MKITRKSPFSGQVNTMEISATTEQFDAWKSGTLVQNAFPNLTADEREFIMTGITAAEWAATFPKDA